MFPPCCWYKFYINIYIHHKLAEGRILVEGGVGQSASGSGDTTAPDLHWQEASDSGGVGGFTAYFRGIREGDGLRGRGEAPGAVVAAGGI